MRSNQSGSGDEVEIGVDGHGEPRIRDRNKKMKVPCFGLVYKRQMAVNAIVVVLISAYITLLCLI